jgi:hypothetical protein
MHAHMPTFSHASSIASSSAGNKQACSRIISKGPAQTFHGMVTVLFFPFNQFYQS